MTQEQFEYLLKVHKVFEKDPPQLTPCGGKGSFVLLSDDSREEFVLDIHRNGTFTISKTKMQTRTGHFLMVRIEINATPHRNPDGRKIGRNHIHIYKPNDPETGSLPWAYEFDEVRGLNLTADNPNFMSVFHAMCEYCNIEASNIQGVI